MTDEEKEMEESWDPQKAKDEISAKKLRMPIEFKFDEKSEIDMQFEPKPPKEKDLIAKPKIIDGKKNKGSLF